MVLGKPRWKDTGKKIRDARNDLTVLNPPFPSQTDVVFNIFIYLFLIQKKISGNQKEDKE